MAVAAAAWRCAALGALLCGTRVLAMDYGAPPDSAEWKLLRSPLECRLSQRIPVFGEAAFRQRAGESAQFVLSSRVRLRAGDARVLAEAPPWREPTPPVLLGQVPVQGAPTPVQAGDFLAGRVLEALLDGMFAVFEDVPSHALSGHSRIRLAPVNFRAAYADYQECLDGLLSTSFAQVAKQRLNFDDGSTEIGDAAKARLDMLLQHVELGKSLKAIHVDGYADDRGRPSQNLELSKQRAQAVTDYLVSKGVDPALVQTQYHGMRYPLVRGRGAAARAENRRVTVRAEPK